MKITRGHHISFKHALDGLVYAFVTQPNFRVHTYSATVVLFLGYFLQVSYLEWLILTLVMFAVFIVELLNTSIEEATDLVVTEHNPTAKAAKDTAAAAVLLTALGALTVGMLIFGPKLLLILGI